VHFETTLSSSSDASQRKWRLAFTSE